VTVPGGGTYQYSYDSSGRLTTVTDPDSNTRTYHYENSTFPIGLTGITDESNQRYATFAYDDKGRPSLSELAGGADRITATYVSGSIISSAANVTMPLGATINYVFTIKQGSARVATQNTYCEGCPVNAKSLTYDTNGNITIRKDFNNRETRYVYDTTRNLETSRTEAYGTAKARTITTAWHSTFRLPTSITEPNRTTTFTHDSSGNVLTRTVTDTSVTPNVSRTWTYTYNSFGQILTENGPRTDVTDVTTYTYYGTSATCAATVTGATTTGCRGQLESVTNALSHVTIYNEYNAHGQALKITDANGLVVTLAYDTMRRLTSRAAGGETTSFEYWPTGLLKKVTLPDSSFLLYTYDAAHRLTRVDDADGNHIVYTLDAAGNRTKEETFDPSNYLTRLHHRAFNTLNQLWKEIGSANTAAVTTTFGYDLNGNVTSANAPLSRNTSNLYDELNRLKQITDPASGTTQFAYDANDNLTSVTDPRSKVTSYAYTGFGDLKQQTSPDTGITTNTFDSGGNLATSTDARGKTGTYTYDALNRVTQLSYPDQTITYTYDSGTGNKGRLMQVSDGLGSSSWTYTSLGRVASRTQSMGVSKTVGYGYNSAGQLTSITTPSGQTVTYGYLNNQIDSIAVNSTTVLEDVIYDPFGPARQWTWGNSTLTAREFDQDGLVGEVDSAGLRTYAQDDAFRITGITDTINSALTWSYGYDSLDRLTSASKTGQSQTWTYDANGNRLTQGGTTSSTFTISTTNNRLSSVSGAISRTYSYDSAGNATGYSGLTFTYNDAGRMTAVSGSASATYSHNALGQRVKKAVGGATTYFVYDEAGRLIGEYDSSGGLIQETVWLDGTPVATLQPNGVSVSIFYVHADHLNTPRRITRPSDSAIVWRWDSNPFGTDTPNQDPDGDSTQFTYNVRFPGQYFDAETGLSYNYFRDYDPQIGRYVESDPIGLKGGINTYAYVKDNPIAQVDSFGLCSCPGGEWKQEFGDSTLSVAFGGYASVGRINYICRSRPNTKCSATQVCIGGGPIFGGGLVWSLYGRQYTADSSSFSGWSGWNVTGSFGPIAGTANIPGPGGNWSAGLSLGVGLGLIRCINIGLECTCDCEQ
jgi:RHS repeat-associated protein